MKLYTIIAGVNGAGKSHQKIIYGKPDVIPFLLKT